MTRKILATAAKNLPQEFDLDELVERLIFIEKVEEGLKEIAEGKGISFEDAKKIAAGWRK